jgi:hypothetical protein
MEELVSRREVISIAATTFAGGVMSSRTTSEDDEEKLEIGIYMTETAAENGSASEINELSQIIESQYDPVFPDMDTRIGPHDVIEVEPGSASSAREAANWWNGKRDDYRHSQLLMFSQRQVDWDNFAGFALYNSPAAVCVGAEVAGAIPYVQRLAAHEVAHNFNMYHRYAEKRGDKYTLMSPDIDDTIMEFSDRTKRNMRRQVQPRKYYK